MKQNNNPNNDKEYSSWICADKEEVLWFKVNMDTGNVRFKADIAKLEQRFDARTGKRREH